MKAKIYITFKNSNIHVNITNMQDRTCFQASCFSKAKTQPNIMFYTNLLVSVFTYVASQKISKVFIFISGFHSKRFSFLKDFFSRIRPVKILRVFYVSGKAFNGCRKKKIRRL